MPNLNRTPIKKAQNSQSQSKSHQQPSYVIQTNTTERQPDEDSSKGISLHELSILETDITQSNVPKIQNHDLFSQDDKSVLKGLLTTTNPNEAVTQLHNLLFKFSKSYSAKVSRISPSGIIQTSVISGHQNPKKTSNNAKDKDLISDSTFNNFPNASFGDYMAPHGYVPISEHNNSITEIVQGFTSVMNKFANHQMNSSNKTINSGIRLEVITDINRNPPPEFQFHKSQSLIVLFTQHLESYIEERALTSEEVKKVIKKVFRLRPMAPQEVHLILEEIPGDYTARSHRFVVYKRLVHEFAPYTQSKFDPITGKENLFDLYYRCKAIIEFKAFRKLTTEEINNEIFAKIKNPDLGLIDHEFRELISMQIKLRDVNMCLDYEVKKFIKLMDSIWYDMKSVKQSINNVTSSFVLTCDNCGQTGHSNKFCPSLPNNIPCKVKGCKNPKTHRSENCFERCKNCMKKYPNSLHTSLHRYVDCFYNKSKNE